MCIAACVVLVICTCGCTTLERQTVRDAFLDHNPYTDYVWDEEKGMGVWKVDEAALLQAIIDSNRRQKEERR